MVLTPNDQYLVVSCASQWSDAGTSVQIINLSGYTVTSVSNGSNPLIRLAMSPVGDYVYASSKWGQVTSSGTSITQIAIPSGVISSTFSVQTSAGSTTADGPSFININGAGDNSNGANKCSGRRIDNANARPLIFGHHNQ